MKILQQISLKLLTTALVTVTLGISLAMSAHAVPKRPDGGTCDSTGTERKEGTDADTGEKLSCDWDTCTYTECSTGGGAINQCAKKTTYSNATNCTSVRATGPNWGKILNQVISGDRQIVAPVTRPTGPTRNPVPSDQITIVEQVVGGGVGTSGYACTLNPFGQDKCSCTGGSTGDDCKEMLDKKCKGGSDAVLTCTGNSCTCNWHKPPTGGDHTTVGGVLDLPERQQPPASGGSTGNNPTNNNPNSSTTNSNNSNSNSGQFSDEARFANNTGLTSQCFSYQAVAMTPYNESASQYSATHSSVKHKGNIIGNILLYGPVQPWDSLDGDIFSATFKDPDGAANNSEVTAQLRFVSANGIKIIKTLKSNDFAQAIPGAQTMSATLSRKDTGYRNGHYIVRMNIKRNNLSKPAAYGYNICGAIF